MKHHLFHSYIFECLQDKTDVFLYICHLQNMPETKTKGNKELHLDWNLV